MKAKVGDFLVVKGTTTERHDQHAEIIEVRSQDGSPPYVVRWLVTDHEATVYPGSDAVVVTAAEHTHVLPKLFAQLWDALERDLEALGVARHAAVVPAQLAEFAMKRIWRT